MRYLLIVGDNYYPRHGTDDWKRTFDSYEDAKAAIVRIEHFRTILKGKNKGQQEQTYVDYLFDGVKYDWYEIVDLQEWLNQ